MKINQYEIWLANLSPSLGTEPGKTRPVVVVQTNLMNAVHPSTLICPITSQINLGATILRVHLNQGILDQLSDILVDQIRAIDNNRMMKKIGSLSKTQISQLKKNLKIVLDIGS
jgi:mRNA interferase MazF